MSTTDNGPTGANVLAIVATASASSGCVFMNESRSSWEANSVNAPGAKNVKFNSVEVVNDGSDIDYATLPFQGPATIGGNSYKLISVEYCMRPGPGAGATVEVVYVDSNNPNDFINDDTDRTLTGCYVVDTSTLAAAQGYHLSFGVRGAVGTLVAFEGVQSTWTKV